MYWNKLPFFNGFSCLVPAIFILRNCLHARLPCASGYLGLKSAKEMASESKRLRTHLISNKMSYITHNLKHIHRACQFIWHVANMFAALMVICMPNFKVIWLFLWSMFGFKYDFARSSVTTSSQKTECLSVAPIIESQHCHQGMDK